MIDNILESFALRQGYSCAEITAVEDAYKRKHRLSHQNAQLLVKLRSILKPV